MSDKKIEVEFSKVVAEPIIKFARLKKDRDTQDKETDINIVYPPVDISEILETAATSAWHGRCLEIKTKAIAGTYDIDEREKAFLIEAFREYDTVEEVFSNIVQDFENTGNCYIEVVKSGSKIKEL